MHNIVVSGYYGSKNGGDEAMLAAMIEILSELDPQLNITVISANPEDTRKRHGVEAVSWLDLPEIFCALKRADLLISGGGSLLQNVTSGRSLYYYMGIICLAHMLGTRVMLYAQGIGPIYGTIARRVMSWLGNHVDVITVRDHGSLEELESLRIHSPHIECTADPVLAINPVSHEAGRRILFKYHADDALPLVGISVREWKGWNHYKEVLAGVADAIVKELGARVVFLPMQYPEDVRVAEAIAEMAGEECTVLEDEYTTSELLSLVGCMDLMVSIRLHALIFAGVMGVPMIGVSYDPKVERFMDSIGDRIAGGLEDITVEGLMEEVRRKWDGKEAFRQQNAALLSELRRLAARNAELAMDAMGNTPHGT